MKEKRDASKEGEVTADDVIDEFMEGKPFYYEARGGVWKLIQTMKKTQLHGTDQPSLFFTFDRDFGSKEIRDTQILGVPYFLELQKRAKESGAEDYVEKHALQETSRSISEHARGLGMNPFK